MITTVFARRVLWRWPRRPLETPRPPAASRGSRRLPVYANTGGHADTTPYLLDVQSDLLDGLDSRVVIPLRSLTHFPQIRLPARLTPVLTIEGTDCLLETPKMGAVPLRALTSPVTSLAHAQEQITAALDFLFQGY